MTAATPLRALVVYESMFGNTEKVAGAVLHGLQHEGVDTGLVEAGSAPATLPDDLDLLVVGGPTHGFSMSRVSTRADAVRQGAPAERTATRIRESVRLGGERRPVVAAFDTRVTKVRWIPQAAGPSAARAARRRGLEVVAKPVGFLVDDIRGPLLDNELEHAVAWGRRLATELTDRAAAGTTLNR
jgi:Flavodoxin